MMSTPNLPSSLRNFDDLTDAEPPIDRYIKSRTTLEDIETAYKISPYRATSLSPVKPNNENHLYGNILKINLRQKAGNKAKTVSDFSMFDDPPLYIPDSTRLKERPIPKHPFKVLDAPNLLDDFYVNVIDWSLQHNVAVGLGNTAYLWNFYNSGVEKIFEFDPLNLLTSLCWDMTSESLVLGGLNGRIEVLDVERKKYIRHFDDHSERVGALSLHGNMLISGSRDQNIYLRDLRCDRRPVHCYSNHYQEVCGLKWSPDGQYFASGGNDNYLYIFSPKITQPLMKKIHKAAVRAIAWSERQYGVLATGAGTADRCIRLWNVNERRLVDIKDAGSQVCNIVFSKNDDELITTHGFSQNDICVWKRNGLKKTHSLTGHTSRILHLAISPCGEFIVTGAGDETLRFWNLGYSKATPKTKERAGMIQELQANMLR
jgi:cell division cycle 20-like protein 1 (cofactor of APC complex)